MKYTRLKDSDISFSGLALGTWGYSGASVWGKAEDDISKRTIWEAIDSGINVIDTADRYGDGHSEEVLGQAIKGIRDRVVICSKVRLPDRKSIIEHCNASLARMKTDYIDIYQVHWPFRGTDMEETLGAYEELKKEGKIREIGVCNFGPECIKMSRGHHVVSNQLPYSLIWRLIEKNRSIDLSIEAGMTVWAYVPLAQGLLTGKFLRLEDVPLNRRATRMYDSKWGQGRHSDGGFESIIFPFLQDLDRLCKETGYSMVDLAFGFLKAQKNVTTILAGAKNQEQLRSNLASYEKEIPADLIDRITKMSDSLKEQMGTNIDLWENENGGRIF
ncbi:MAG: aldo/keto reductase [Spirochaetales bacterium]|nr:aldo/keto reductase [Spirochaetales bacterium]